MASGAASTAERRRWLRRRQHRPRPLLPKEVIEAVGVGPAFLAELPQTGHVVDYGAAVLLSRPAAHAGTNPGIDPPSPVHHRVAPLTQLVPVGPVQDTEQAPAPAPYPGRGQPAQAA